VKLIDLEESERLVGIARVEREEETEESQENGAEEMDGGAGDGELFDTDN